MNNSVTEECAELQEQKDDVFEDAVAFVKQLEVLGFDKKTLRFEGELSNKEILVYKNRLIELINSVDKLD